MSRRKATAMITVECTADVYAAEVLDQVPIEDLVEELRERAADEGKPAVTTLADRLYWECRDGRVTSEAARQLAESLTGRILP